MNFDLTDEQKLLVDTVATFVKKQSPVSRHRALREDATGWSRDVWRQMGEYGWIGVWLPESVGGSGGTFADVALILEQLGTTLAPEPFLAALAAGTPIVRAGTEEQQTRWLAPLAEGAISLALAHAEVQSRFDVADVTTTATREGEGYRLDGHKRWVLNGHAADVILVSARTSGDARSAEGVSLFAVDRDAPGLTIQSVKTMDGQHAAMITLAGVTVGADRRIGPEGGAFTLLEEAMDIGAAAACAEGAGLLRTVLQMTVDYLQTRQQFGVKIGSFQALQHKAVDMFVETELCKSTAILAAIRASDPDPVERKSGISAAKAQLTASGKLVTQQAIQLHGGIGVTDEHDIGLYFKRMHVLTTLFGDEEFHVARYAWLPSFTAGIDG